MQGRLHHAALRAAAAAAAALKARLASSPPHARQRVLDLYAVHVLYHVVHALSQEVVKGVNVWLQGGGSSAALLARSSWHQVNGTLQQRSTAAQRAWGSSWAMSACKRNKVPKPRPRCTNTASSTQQRSARAGGGSRPQAAAGRPPGPGPLAAGGRRPPAPGPACAPCRPAARSLLPLAPSTGGAWAGSRAPGASVCVVQLFRVQ